MEICVFTGVKCFTAGNTRRFGGCWYLICGNSGSPPHQAGSPLIILGSPGSTEPTEVQPISIVYSTSRGVMHLQGADALAGSRVMD